MGRRRRARRGSKKVASSKKERSSGVYTRRARAAQHDRRYTDANEPMAMLLHPPRNKPLVAQQAILLLLGRCSRWA